MPAKRIMLLGASGQIGRTLQSEILPDNWQLGAYARDQLDITQHHKVQTAIHDFKPDLIINAAAMTAVDEAEKNPVLAIEVNFNAVANMAAQCSALDIPLIHLSTDYVFDGSDGIAAYRPDDQMNPVNVYGETKMMAEEALRHGLAWHVILRVSSIFGALGKNLLTNMLKIIDERDEITVPAEQKSCPTYARDIAEAIIVIAGELLKGKHNGYGTFHLCGTPAAERMEFVQAVMDAYAPYTSRRPKVTAVSNDSFGDRAPRPPSSVLDCAKIHAVYGIAQKPWRDGLAEAMGQLMRDRERVA